MKLRKTLAAAGALAIAGSAFALQPSQAASDTTTVTYDLTAGTLSIDAPATASGAGTAAALATVDAGLTATTVVDNTGSLLGWDVTATATDLTGTADVDGSTKTIPKSNMTWITGTVAAGSNGSLLDILGSTAVTAGAGGPFLTVAGSDVPVVVATAALNSGGGTYSYPATVRLTVPVNTFAGDYSAVITQTVL